MVEVIAEDEVVAVNGRFWREAEGDAILVVGFAMFGEGEVGGRGGRGVWEAAVGLCYCGQWSTVEKQVCCIGGTGGNNTCILTFKSTLICSESIVIGVDWLTGTILCVLISYSDPADTCKT